MSVRSSIWLDTRFQTFLLGLVVLLVFAATRTQLHSGDDIQWAMQVQSSVTGEPMLHPAFASTFIVPVTGWQKMSQVRYFLELPTTTRIYDVSRMMNWAENADLPIQFMHVVAGTIGAVFFFLGLALFMPRTWSFIITLGFTFSYAWWYYSTHLDYTIISHALSCILFYLLASLNTSSAGPQLQWRVLALGAVNGFTILYLMTGVLLIPVMLVALLQHYDEKKSRFKTIALYLSSLFTTVLVVGGIAWMSDVGTVPSWTNLVGNLSYKGAFAHDFALSDVPRTLYGFSKALVTYPALNDQQPHDFLAAANLRELASFAAWYACIMAIVVSPFLMLTRLYKQLGTYRNLAITLGIWFFIQVPFAAYWEPSYIKWWTSALIPWWGLIGLLLVVPSARTLLRKSLSVAVPALVVILFSVNFFSEFLPNSLPNSNRWLETAHALSNTTGTSDLFISSENHPLDFYLPYFTKRHTLSYNMINISKGQDATLKDMKEAMRFTTEHDGRIFIFGVNDQSIKRLTDMLNIPLAQYEKVVFERVSSLDFVVYEVIETRKP